MSSIRLKITRTGNAEYFKCSVGDVVELDVDDYVCGVVASEIGEVELEACKAQAVAARTNALVYTELSDTGVQAFRAERMSYTGAKLASQMTTGEVITYDGKLCSPCSFSANNGGRTVSSKERWGGERAYLITKDDPWDGCQKRTGHGVGMSQAGAINMAKNGWTYDEILAFYYPGTVIQKRGGSMSVTANELIADFKYAYENKFGYIYGASGAMWTAAKQSALQKETSSNYDLSKQYGSKWIGHYVVDCSGFFVWAFKKHGLSIAHGSNSIWNKYCTVKGSLANGKRTDGGELRPGTAVFKLKGTDYHHIGLYIGDGKCIESQGSKTGVIMSSITTWNTWGELKNVDYNNLVVEVKLMSKATVTAESGKSVNMRAAPQAGATLVAQIPVGSIVDCGDTSDGWTAIQYNGKTGYMMSKFLVSDGAQDTTVSVILDVAVAKSLYAALAKALA